MSNKDKTAVSGQTSKKGRLMPKLRFPEFRNVGDWKFEPLSKLATRCTVKNTDGEYTRVLTNSAEFGVVDQRDFFDKDIANQGNLDGYFIVKKGDYVYNPRISTAAPVGPISKNNLGTGVMSPLYTVFRFDSADNDFYAHYFKSTHWHHYMRQSASTGARHDRMSITNSDFARLPLPVSIPEEQRKVSDCLSSINGLISAETEKLEKLQSHKAALIQQLFPREGETFPPRRFPKFKNAPKWETSGLSKFISALDAGVSVNSGDRPAGDQEVGILKTSCVTTGVFDISENKVVLELKELERVKEPVKKDTIIISRMNTPALVGANAYVEFDHGNLFLPDRLWAAKSTSEGYMRFISYVLGSERGRSALRELATGTSDSMKNISKSAVLDLEITAPGVLEQKKIAECLSSLDTLIAAQGQKVTALKTFKNALMQRLFPRAVEVSA